MFGSLSEFAGKPFARTLSGKPEFAAEIEQSCWPEFGFAEARATGRSECLRGEERRIEAGAGIGEWAVFLPAIENAVAAAEDELVGQLVSQSDAGREIVEVGSDESARTVTLNGELGGERGRQLRVLSAGNDQRERVEIERCLRCYWPL